MTKTFVRSAASFVFVGDELNLGGFQIPVTRFFFVSFFLTDKKKEKTYYINDVFNRSFPDKYPDRPMYLEVAFNDPNKKVQNLYIYKEILKTSEVIQTTTYTTIDGYRYGFNGMEKDDEVKGKGNSYDFGARMQDPRLGRFLSVDPKATSYPFMTPYCYAANNPILFVDVNGEGPGDPLHHEFLTTAAIEIYNAAKSKGASTRGAILVMAQASIESGYGKSAIKNGDFNLFGTMTLGSDYKVTTSHGRVKDFSKSGGYKASIEYYFEKNNKTWPEFSKLIKQESITSDQIDKAFYTGKYIEWAEQRNKTGHYSYNFDHVNEALKINENKYGESLISQMNSFEKRFIKSLDYQIEQNNTKIKELDFKIELGKGVLTQESIDKLHKEKTTLTAENEKLNTIKTEIQGTK